MRFDALTLFPELFDLALTGVTGRAFRDLGHVLEARSWRPFAGNTFGHVDDSPFGGGPGMVLRPDVARDALASLPRSPRRRVIHFSPAAPPLDHAKVLELAQLDQVVLLCTRFEGLDQRAVDLYVDEELRVGEAVLSGGELPALVLIDAVCRWLPGVLGNSGSAGADSFAQGLLDHTHYTRPAEFEGFPVPEVLQGGNHEAIRLHRLREAMARTRRLRPDLWEAYRARIPALPPADQWCAWQAEHPDDWDRPRPKGWKSAGNPGRFR